MAKRQRRARSIKQRRADRAANQPQGISSSVWIAGGGVLLLLLVAGLFYLGYNGQQLANSGIEGLEIFPEQSRTHVNGDVNYDQEVPPGGSHNAEWLNCGIFDEPVRTENVLHSMEHGAVWLAYNPELPAEQISLLRNTVSQERSSRGEPLIVLSPYPGLSVPIVAAAWRVRLELEDAMDERLQDFLDRYQRGPFTPEPGASCAFGGVME